jgi:prepilin-type processing-associated H-X9-DG protein
LTGALNLRSNNRRAKFEMDDSLNDNRDFESATIERPPASIPKFRFGLKALFAATAIVAALSAGGRAGGVAGAVLVALGISFAIWFWAWLTNRDQLRKLFSKISGVGLLLSLLFAFLVPAIVSSPRVNTRRGQCENNLKNLGLALLEYDHRNQHLPAVFTTDVTGKPLTSWRTAILPLIERTDLYSQYRANEPWDSPQNNPLSQIHIELFECPSDAACGASNNTTTYVAVVGPGTAWQPGKAIKLSDIKDKLSETILLVEMESSGIAWSEPRDLDLNNLPTGLTKQALLKSLSAHQGGFNALFADGHVEFIPSTIPWSQFIALTTIAGGEKIDRASW